MLPSSFTGSDTLPLSKGMLFTKFPLIVSVTASTAFPLLNPINSVPLGTDSQDNKSSYEDMKYDFAEDEKLREVLSKTITFVGINIEIIGNWIWIDGDTYSYKDEVKAMGFKWAREKKKWYFHTEAFRKRSHKKLSIDDIRNYYGSTVVETEGRKQLKQA